jgi:hypothetical protein
MASSRRRSITGASLALAVPVAALWLATSAPLVGPASRGLLVVLGVVALVGDVAVLAVAATVRNPARPDEDGSDEDALLRPPRLPVCVRDVPVVGVVGLEPLAGSSTVALNAAVALALDGRVGDGERRPLPACVLTEGSLTARLGIAPGNSGAGLRQHTRGVAEDFVEHARRVAGCVDVLAVPAGELGGARLTRLISALRRDHDAVIVECSASDRYLAGAVADQADVVLACALPPRGRAGVEVEQNALRLIAGRTHKAVLVVNRQRAAGPFASLLPGFTYRVEVAADPAVERSDRAGRPWVLWRSSTAADRLRVVMAALLPRLHPGEVSDAA